GSKRVVLDGKITTVAELQKKAYPDIIAIRRLGVTVPKLYWHAFNVAKRMGWDIVAFDEKTGRIEATDTTFWFGFKDDIVIRVRPANGGSRIDVRSLSRVGRGDTGTNARRIRAYVRELAK